METVARDTSLLLSGAMRIPNGDIPGDMPGHPEAAWWLPPAPIQAFRTLLDIHQAVGLEICRAPGSFAWRGEL